MDHVILYRILVLCGYVESMFVNEFIAIIRHTLSIFYYLQMARFSLGEGIFIKEFCWLVLNHAKKKSYGSYKSNAV